MIKIILFVFSLSLLSCRYKEIREPAPHLHTLRKGEKFRITLPENHEKKESWSSAETHDPRIVRRLNDVWHGNEKGIDFNFLCVGSGSTMISLVKRTYSDTLADVNYLVKITDN